MEQDIYQYILTEEANYQTSGVPIVDGYEWKMYEHVKLSTLYRDSKFSQGPDDGSRPYKNIIRPIRNVGLRSEGFDVKDIEPFVDNSDNYYKSFLVRKFHEKWARRNDIDTAIDESVESYFDYGGVLAMKGKEAKPDIMVLQQIAFVDQTDILSGPICFKMQFSVDQLLDYKDKWDNDAIDEVITASRAERATDSKVNIKAKTPGKYIELYVLHGMLPLCYLDENGSDDEYVRQMQVISYVKKENEDKKTGITLYKGREADGLFKVLLRDKIYGRALGFGGIEELFESQIWTNYNQIQIKQMLDQAADMILQTEDKAFQNKNKLKDREKGEVVVHAAGQPLTQVMYQPINFRLFERLTQDWELHARTTGSANDAQLGINPTSGTPFVLQQMVTSTGQGIHEYRRGKIATFWGEIYRDWVIPELVKEMNQGDEWLADLNLEEMQYIAEQISTKQSNAQAVDMVIKYFDKEGQAPEQADIDVFKEVIKKNFMKGGNKRFLELAKGELSKIPIDVEINIAGKQKNLGKIADGLTNIFRTVIAAPGILKDPGMAKLFNEIVEASGFSPVNFQGLEAGQPQAQQQLQTNQPQSSMPGQMPMQTPMMAQ